MYAIYLPELGHVQLYLKTLFVSGGEYHINGKDDEGRKVTLHADRASFPDDYFDDYGWAHIVSYALNGIVHECVKYVSFG